MLSNNTMEVAALTHCFHDPKFIDFLSSESFTDLNRKLLYNAMVIVRNENHHSLTKFSELKLTNFANNERYQLEKYLGKEEKYKLHAFPDYVVSFCRSMPDYNPLESDYIANKLREYEYVRSVRESLLDGAKRLESNESVEQVLNEITSLNPTLFSRVSNFWENMDEAEKEKTEFIPFASLQLSNMFKPRNICTVFADTGCLKTGFTIYMAIMFLKANPGKRVMYFEKEMPKEDIVDRLICYFMNIENTMMYADKTYTYNMMRAYTSLNEENQPQEVKEIIDILLRFIIIGPDEFKNADDVVKMIRYHEPDLWVLDFITQLSQGEAKGNSDFNMIVMETCNKLKGVTQYGHPCLGIIISQIKKGTVELRSNKVPLMDDMEWSGTLKHVSSQTIALFKPDVYYDENIPHGAFIAMVRKNRYGIRNSVMHYIANPAKNQFTENHCEEIRQWFSNYRSKDLRR